MKSIESNCAQSAGFPRCTWDFGPTAQNGAGAISMPFAGINQPNALLSPPSDPPHSTGKSSWILTLLSYSLRTGSADNDNVSLEAITALCGTAWQTLDPNSPVIDRMRSKLICFLPTMTYSRAQQLAEAASADFKRRLPGDCLVGVCYGLSDIRLTDTIVAEAAARAHAAAWTEVVKARGNTFYNQTPAELLASYPAEEWDI